MAENIEEDFVPMVSAEAEESKPRDIVGLLHGLFTRFLIEVIVLCW